MWRMDFEQEGLLDGLEGADRAEAAKALAAATADDHKDMMRQLGIKALRPGPSGREGAPNQANYDESKANALFKTFVRNTERTASSLI
jgi:hypothetical protein